VKDSVALVHCSEFCFSFSFNEVGIATFNAVLVLITKSQRVTEALLVLHVVNRDFNTSLVLVLNLQTRQS